MKIHLPPYFLHPPLHPNKDGESAKEASVSFTLSMMIGYVDAPFRDLGKAEKNMLAAILGVSSLIPVLTALFATGDFPQMLVKPPRQFVFWMFRYRYIVMLSSGLLLVTALVVRGNSESPGNWFFTLVGFCALFLAFGANYAVPRVMFPTIMQRVRWVTAEQVVSQIAPEDEVIGLEINGDARAYPVKWITRPHVVHDLVGGEPVAMTYCSLSSLGKAFRVGDHNLPTRIQVAFQLENNLVFYDASRKRLIQQIDGGVCDGDGSQTPLHEYSSRLMSWSTWRSLYPHTKVFYNPPHGLLDRGVRQLLKILLTRHYDPANSRPIFPTIDNFDSRLHPKRRVVGVIVNDQRKAYALNYLQSCAVVNDLVGNVPLALVGDSGQDIFDVFRREVSGQTLTFQPGTGDRFSMQDVETGSTWDVKGEAIDGLLKGERLAPFPHASRVFWMIWYNYYPDTHLAGGEETN